MSLIFWPTRTCLTAAQHGKEIEFVEIQGQEKNLTRKLKNRWLYGQLSHNRFKDRLITITYPGLLRAASLSQDYYQTILYPKALRFPQTKAWGPLRRARPEPCQIGIDRITGLDEPHHPSTDQKNRNKYHLGTNSIELDGMNSPPNFQPGERWE